MQLICIEIECSECERLFTGYVHIESVTNENIENALFKNEVYNRFKKSHSHHTIQDGLLIADGE